MKQNLPLHIIVLGVYAFVVGAGVPVGENVPMGAINNPQQSWGFEWEPPKAVMKDSGTRDLTLWGGKIQLRRLRALGIGTVISSLRLIVETKYALFQN